MQLSLRVKFQKKSISIVEMNLTSILKISRKLENRIKIKQLS